MKTVLIGAGYRGRALAGLLRGMPFFELTAVADPLLGGIHETCHQQAYRTHDGIAHPEHLKIRVHDGLFGYPV